MRTCFLSSTTTIAFATLVLCAAAVAARADVLVYTTNFGTFSGGGPEIGGATSGNLFTNLAAEQITPIAGVAGRQLSSILIAVGSFNSSTVTFDALIRLYDTTPGGTPGNLFGQFELDSLSLSPDTLAAFGTGDITGSHVFLPNTPTDQGTFWAGISLAPSGDTTAAELNQLDLGLYGVPALGSNTDQYFVSNDAGDFTANDPSGSFVNFPGGPQSSFGFQFTSPVVIPESSTSVLIGGGMVMMAMLGLRPRRKAA